MKIVRFHKNCVLPDSTITSTVHTPNLLYYHVLEIISRTKTLCTRKFTGIITGIIQIPEFSPIKTGESGGIP